MLVAVNPPPHGERLPAHGFRRRLIAPRALEVSLARRARRARAGLMVQGPVAFSRLLTRRKCFAVEGFTSLDVPPEVEDPREVGEAGSELRGVSAEELASHRQRL